MWTSSSWSDGRECVADIVDVMDLGLGVPLDEPIIGLGVDAFRGTPFLLSAVNYNHCMIPLIVIVRNITWQNDLSPQLITL